ncbi:cadherin-87A [Anabrus simplex]|uniref:cadherin-87A n=1 Tax=Anabrus simplex TaxID=316456 RepID=UPI0035A2A46E
MMCPVYALVFPVLLLVVGTQGQLNRAPQFVPGGDMARFSLPEDTPVGSPVYRLQGVDPEGSNVHYSISGEHLTVERSSGVVTLLKPLDRETIDLIEVIISITDEGIAGSEPNTVSLRRELPVLDVNDNPPVFQGRPYSFTVPETAAVGTTLYSNVSVTDADGGVNADIVIRCVGGDDSADSACSTFGITTEKLGEGHYVASISLLRQLDYERQTGYILKLRATDQAAELSKRLIATANVAIDVMDVQDQPPIFLNAPYSASVSEGTAPGSSVLHIRARDGDLGASRNVLLTLEDDTLGYFRLEPKVAGSGQGSDLVVSSADLVTSNTSIDREHPDILQNGGIYTFTIKATELINNELPGDTTTSQVTIVVTDMDDQVPTFNQDHFHINVSEDIGIDTPLPGLNMVAHDRDVGDNARYSLKLRNVRNAAGAFTVHPSNATGRSPVVVRVADVQGLDYDVDDPNLREVVFDVIASIKDSNGNDKEVGSSRVTVNLVDANDNSPIFTLPVYRVRVMEDAKPGSFIANMSATDKDSGEYGKIYYAIRGFGAEKFYSHPTKGGLFVANKSQGLDYETQKSYSLSFEARDGGGRVSTANLFVEVGDVNDNKPIFEQREYSRTVREGATSFEPQLFVRATDLDGPEQGGGKIFYSIQSTNSPDVFFVEPISGEVKLNSPARAADTVRGQYELVIRATDAGKPPLHDDTRIIVRVGVPGNQRPIFRGNRNVGNAPSGYSATVYENAPSGTDVVQVMATDPDGQDSLLSYFIAGGARDNFVIDKSQGRITVSPEARLDLETSGSRYDIIVHAVDSGTPIRETATTTVIVDVLDVNNKPPVFPSSDTSSYVRYISERIAVDETVLNVTAIDPDSDAQLEYSIIEPIRAADHTGVALKSTTPFDYKNAFKINSTTGELKVVKRLDHTAASVIILTVQARDLKAVDNVEDQVATVEVTIYVQAYNDTNPLFTVGGWTPANPIIKVTVPEEQPIGTTLLMLSARDPTNGNTIKRFEEVKTDGNKDIEDFVSVGLQSGNVVLNKRLDFESLKDKVLSFQVRAIAEDRTSEATVMIEVEDINDNSPEFPEEIYRTRIMESVQHPNPILTVRASDRDSNNNETGFGIINYSLTGENAQLFTIDPETGVITVKPNVTLDRERQSSLRFIVVATDTPQGGSNQRKGSATVMVEVLDVNDNAPAFSKSLYSAVVPENVATGSSVLSITASDPDEGLGGEVAYELLDEGDASGLFSINHTTGRIVTRRALTGKGRTEPYHLILRAQDSGTPPLSTDVSLSIYIGDVFSNDGVPIFIRPTLEEIAQVSENSSLGSPVFQVVASDPDDPNTPNGKVTYKFLDNGVNTVAFKIDHESGLISTRQLLDREQRENYTLILVVQDQGQPPQQATRELRIQVLDIDDHKPLFKRSLEDEPIVLAVEEEVELGTEVGTVEAVDEDIGENGMIDYLITYGNEDGLFTINRTEDNKGLITVAKRLDREAASEHVLTIQCFKKSLKPMSLRKKYNRQDPSQTQVRVKVEDIDDNRPRFIQDNITIGVRLNVPVDTSLFTLEALDVDSSSQPINYRLINTTFFSLAVSVMDTVSVPANQDGVFQLNEKTGDLRTSGSMQGYADGYFELQIMANNSDTPGMETYTTLKIFVLRDRDLLKFVFSKPPADVRRALPDFRQEVERALLLPVSLNVYDTQFYAKEDGSLDFSSTSSCFQLVGQESYDLKDMESLMLDENNADLDQVYGKYGVQSIQRCAPVITKAEASWIQLWVLAIACLIGIGAFMSGIVTCCLYSRYKRLAKHALLRDAPRVPVSSISYLSGSAGGPPAMIITPPPGASDAPRMYEWGLDGSTLPPGHDNMSYHSFPAR